MVILWCLFVILEHDPYSLSHAFNTSSFVFHGYVIDERIPILGWLREHKIPVIQ